MEAEILIEALDRLECRHSPNRETVQFTSNEFGFRNGVRQGDGTV
jgi:hypothetical protein